MAIIQKIPTVSNRFSPLSAMAAISVIMLCMAGTAAIAGWLPAHQSNPYLPPVSSAPEVSPIAAPVAAPVVAPAPDRSMQPRVRRASHLTSTT
ncbi:hypothetical protein LJR289_004467 [Pseudoduganella sp. LjRoot289]|uniref:hypothetical protein n=1 Tax=Pseudoduganella sp. LjRoot289 TaxID=3342314 RepID=UPI003ECFB2AC